MCIRVKSCCCGCCKLETGCKSIAWLSIIASGVSIAFAFFGGSFIRIGLAIVGLAINLNFCVGVYTRESCSVMLWLILHAIGAVAQAIVASCAVVLVVMMICQEKHAEEFGGDVLDMFGFNFHDNQENIIVLSVLVSSWTLFCVVNWYCFAVVYTFYKQLRGDW